MSTPCVTVITGTSSGFGFETATLLAAAGHRVFGTMRDVEGRNAEPARRLAALGVETIELDVTDEASVDRAAAKILDHTGRVDVLVNNAGAAYFGAAETFTPSAFERQFSTNVTGPFRVSRAFLPGMRANRDGLVVFVSSTVGRFVIPYMGVYTATKWAIEALAESLSYELRPFEVDVAIVEPGAYPTNLFNVITGSDDATRLATYEEAEKSVQSLSAIFGTPSARKPLEIAEAIGALVALPAGARPLRTVVASGLADERAYDGAPASAINALAAPVQRSLVQSYGFERLIPRELVASAPS